MEKSDSAPTAQKALVAESGKADLKSSVSSKSLVLRHNQELGLVGSLGGQRVAIHVL